MRKRVAALVIFVNVFMLLVGSTQTQSVTRSLLNRQKAVELIKDNSSAIWDAEEGIKFAKKDYEEQAARSRSINTVKIFLFVNPYTDEDIYYYYDSAEQMQMILMKEFFPESMKFSYEVKQKVAEVTENAMANAADNLFVGLYSTYHSIGLAEKSLELAEKNLKREQKRFENGMITELDLQGALLEVRASEDAIVKAKRDYENTHRQFNAMANLPLSFRYDLIGTPWANEHEIPITQEQAIASALENRMEIWSTMKQIELVELRMEIYRHKKVYTFHQQTKKDYEAAQDELDELIITLSQQRYDIEKEIRQAYQELKKCYNDLELAKLNLAKQENLLNTTKTQYESGIVPISVIEQLEHAIEQLDFVVDINLVNLLNKQDQLYRAISAGPGY
ncbi:MAG TPA: TolC family protein [Thermoclostridium sp.]|nr:TolC family protein [Thermoclostridium sp.]